MGFLKDQDMSIEIEEGKDSFWDTSGLIYTFLEQHPLLSEPQLCLKTPKWHPISS